MAGVLWRWWCWRGIPPGDGRRRPPAGHAGRVGRAWAAAAGRTVASGAGRHAAGRIATAVEALAHLVEPGRPCWAVGDRGVVGRRNRPSARGEPRADVACPGSTAGRRSDHHRGHAAGALAVLELGPAAGRCALHPGRAGIADRSGCPWRGRGRRRGAGLDCQRWRRPSARACRRAARPATARHPAPRPGCSGHRRPPPPPGRARPARPWTRARRMQRLQELGAPTRPRDRELSSRRRRRSNHRRAIHPHGRPPFARHYLLAAHNPRQLPPDGGLRSPFAGRSNAGSPPRSTPCASRTLARVSKTRPDPAAGVFRLPPHADRYPSTCPAWAAKVPWSCRRTWQASSTLHFANRFELRGLAGGDGHPPSAEGTTTGRCWLRDGRGRWRMPC